MNIPPIQYFVAMSDISENDQYLLKLQEMRPFFKNNTLFGKALRYKAGVKTDSYGTTHMGRILTGQYAIPACLYDRIAYLYKAIIQD